MITDAMHIYEALFLLSLLLGPELCRVLATTCDAGKMTSITTFQVGKWEHRNYLAQNHRAGLN